MARTYLVFGDIEGKLDVQFVAPLVAPGAILWTFSLYRNSTNLLILFGSPGRIRTIDQPVNSRLLYR